MTISILFAWSLDEGERESVFRLRNHLWRCGHIVISEWIVSSGYRKSVNLAIFIPKIRQLKVKQTKMRCTCLWLQVPSVSNANENRIYFSDRRWIWLRVEWTATRSLSATKEEKKNSSKFSELQNFRNELFPNDFFSIASHKRLPPASKEKKTFFFLVRESKSLRS